MPKTQHVDTETLRTRAERLAQQAAEARAALDAEAAERAAQEREALAARDHEVVANYDDAALQTGLNDAQRELVQALADWPVTKALAAFIAAGSRRACAHLDLMAARSRLGLDVADATPPGTPWVPVLQERLQRIAEREAADQIANERTDKE